jgi:hypothetical protein
VFGVDYVAAAGSSVEVLLVDVLFLLVDVHWRNAVGAQAEGAVATPES